MPAYDSSRLALPLRRLLTSVPVRTIPASTDSSRSNSKRARRFRATILNDSSSSFAFRLARRRSWPSSFASLGPGIESMKGL